MEISNPKVMHSAAGYYIGRKCWEDDLPFPQPYDRLSRYFRYIREAEESLIASKDFYQQRADTPNWYVHAHNDGTI